MSGVRNYCLNTVVTPADGFALTTLANVKLDATVPSDISDPQLTRLINQATGAVQQYCNRVFALQTYKDVFRPMQDVWPVTYPNRRAPIALTVGPVVSIASVAVRGTDGNDTALVAGTDYEFDLKTGQLWRLDANGEPRGWDAVRTTVQYQAGYSVPGQADGPNKLLDVAPDVEDATIRLIKGRFLGKDRDPYLKRDEVAGVGAQEFWVPENATGNMPPDVQDILDNYRIVVVA